MIECHELSLGRSIVLSHFISLSLSCTNVCAIVVVSIVNIAIFVCLFFDIAHIGDHLRALWSWKNGDCKYFAIQILWCARSYGVNAIFQSHESEQLVSHRRVHETRQDHQISSLFLLSQSFFFCSLNESIHVESSNRCFFFLHVNGIQKILKNHQVIKRQLLKRIHTQIM